MLISLPVAELLHLSISFSCCNSVCTITNISFCQKKNESAPQQLASETDEINFAKKIKDELDCYFRNSSFQFSLACDILQGTPFQQRVWQALKDIPSGHVKTYGELAKELNSSARAVGNACRHNSFPVIIPCHRIVSASGIGGYAGDTLDLQKGQINYLQIKQWLLAHETMNDEKRNLK